jgi:Flp pilus assembly protein TadD
MTTDDKKSLGDAATFPGQSQRQPAAEMSLGDARTLGGDSAAGIDTAIDDIEVVDLEARYKPEGRLGQGGMGAVVLAADSRLGRKVAIKRILGEAAGNRMAVQRFLTEAKSIAALNHPNVVQIYDYGRAKDGPFLIMEYVDGGSLAELCRAGAIPLDEAIDLACHICDGLAKAHDAGIVHRDIKPANILLTKDGIPKLTDFGLAKAQTCNHGQTVTGTGAVMGTPDFMPPEQRRDAAEVDHRSDIWSLAATVYQAVTSRSPRIIRLNDIAPALQAVLGKALEDQKDSRYQSAREFREALWQAGGARPSGRGVRPPTPSGDLKQEGQCTACGTVNSDLSRKFCRKCGGQLRVSCLKCDAQTPVWESFCGECGVNQERLLADLLAAFDEKRAIAEKLAAAGSLEQAIVVAGQITPPAHPSLVEIGAWAVGFARDTTAEIERQRAAAARHLAEARQFASARDDAAAIAAIGSIPEPMRDSAARSLLAICRSRLEEAARLVETARNRVASDDLDGLLPTVVRILELQGEAAEFVSLHQRLVSRRDERLRIARDTLSRTDLEGACAAINGARVEDFDESDRQLVRELLACEPFVAPLSEALHAERRGDFIAAAFSLDAIPEAARNAVIPGDSESVAAFVERVRRSVRQGEQLQEREARHAARNEQLAVLRAQKEAGIREATQACARAGLVAENTRCVFETTVGPIVVVIQQSWNASWALWFATGVKAGAFDAAALRVGGLVSHVHGEASSDSISDWERPEPDASLRVVPQPAPTPPHGPASTARGIFRERRSHHGLLVAIDCPAGPHASPAVVLNASGAGNDAAIGWIDLDASADFLVASGELRKLRSDIPGTLLGVVKAVRLASPPDCWDLTPRLQQGLDLAAQSRWEESVAVLEEAVSEDPQDAKAWVGIGYGLRQLGRFEEAIAAMERAVTANPQKSLYLYNMSCYHALAGNRQPAIELLGKAVAMRPEWQETARKDTDFTAMHRDKAFLAVVGDRGPARRMKADLKQGVSLMERGRFEEAVVALRGFTERHPHATDAWVAIGSCLRKLGRPVEAAEAMKAGLASRQHHPRLLYNLACYQSLAGHDTDALRALMTAISLHPQYAEMAAKDRDLDRIRSDPRFDVIVADGREA